MLQARYIRIDGSVPSAERIHLVNQFQKDPETRVAILSIQAAGQVGQKRKHEIIYLKNIAAEIIDDWSDLLKVVYLHAVCPL